MTKKLIKTSFSVVFPRQIQIRRKANDFEDKLKGHFSQPQIISVPDEMDPEVPRMIFNSLHGFSQLIISQVSIVHTTVYSPDWQANMNKGKTYYKERGLLIFDLLDLLDDVKPYFCGVTNWAHVVGDEDDEKILKRIAGLLLKEQLSEDISDVEVKKTKVVGNRFFSNIVIRNFRAWAHPPIQGVIRLSNKAAIERGIEVICDFNDRYAFNENETYFSDKAILDEILEQGFAELDSVLTRVEE